MRTERLEEVKRNSKNAFKYMKNLEKEYLKGKTILDQRNFVHKLKENHTLEEIMYLRNEMKGHKESEMSFTNGFFGIAVPMYVAIFAFLGLFLSGLTTFTGNITEKIIDYKLDNNDVDFEEAFELLNQVNSAVITKFSTAILLVLVFLFILYWNRHRNIGKRLRYLSWLSTIEDWKKNEIDQKENMSSTNLPGDTE